MLFTLYLTRRLGKMLLLCILPGLLGLIVQDNVVRAKETQSRACAPVTAGLEFCSEWRSKNFKLNEIVVLQLSLRNVTGEAIQVGSVPENASLILCCAPYEFSVLEENGTPFSTIVENLKKKSDSGNLTQQELDELFSRCCLNRGSRWGNRLPLAAGQNLKFEVNLSEVYNFDRRGTYHIQVRRNVVTDDKQKMVVIDLEKIEIVID